MCNFLTAGQRNMNGHRRLEIPVPFKTTESEDGANFPGGGESSSWNAAKALSWFQSLIKIGSHASSQLALVGP